METLGLDPAQILSFEAGNEGVRVTATLVDTEGHKVLAQAPGSGFLKHTYVVPFEDELCKPGNINGSNLGEDA
ncbi:hypothetical protein [Brevibacterium aurantiacum]|uniref:hypothetical protein n=1 Tax=Brevibacterium aurantiacum TaxID=273384 RepID=UPI000F64A1BD|nr:hypothetical protein [Brevibacterium aurantiacum]